ncbi:MAG: SRPBCC family protein [Alphaproteobacteria bacterium]|nr:SRPBCC family protein [Alphaproteobacteria bacterium]
MIKAVLVTLAVAAVAIVAVLAYAATMPDTFRVQRSASVKAAPEKIHPLIAGFDRWPEWSPYEHRDPQMKRTRSGPKIGKGAIYEWDGNNNVGKGRMEILDTSPGKIVIKLDFLRPFEASNTAIFTLEPASDGTRVTWAMEGPSQFIGKVMSVFIDMDKMVGKDFETGLASMKAAAEK